MAAEQQKKQEKNYEEIRSAAIFLFHQSLTAHFFGIFLAGNKNNKEKERIARQRWQRMAVDLWNKKARDISYARQFNRKIIKKSKAGITVIPFQIL